MSHWAEIDENNIVSDIANSAFGYIYEGNNGNIGYADADHRQNYLLTNSTAPDGFGYPEGGSRVFQWGWYPVGGASNFDVALTPNYLVATTNVGTVTIS